MSDPAFDRRPATAQEARALAHPLRLRILRLCLDEERTNKELADALGKDPGTLLHHVRVLVDGGFLGAGDPRRGARGSREKPYRATRKSWQLDFGDHIRGPGAAMVAALESELVDAVDALGDVAVIAMTRMALRLSADDRAELVDRLQALCDEFSARDSPAGEPLSLFIALHRQPDPR